MNIDASECRYGRPGDDRTHEPLQAVLPARHGPVVYAGDNPEAYQDQRPDHRKGVLGEVEDVPAVRVEDNGHRRGQHDYHGCPRGSQRRPCLWPPRGAAQLVPIAAVNTTPRKRAKLHLTAPVARSKRATSQAGTPRSNGHPGTPTMAGTATTGSSHSGTRPRPPWPGEVALEVAPGDGPAGPAPDQAGAAQLWFVIHCGDAARCPLPQRERLPGYLPPAGDAPGQRASHWHPG